MKHQELKPFMWMLDVAHLVQPYPLRVPTTFISVRFPTAHAQAEAMCTALDLRDPAWSP